MAGGAKCIQLTWKKVQIMEMQALLAMEVESEVNDVCLETGPRTVTVSRTNLQAELLGNKPHWKRWSWFYMKLGLDNGMLDSSHTAASNSA